jgi:signal transduction histidine kinase/ActR/RegA family two-component response regulator
MTSNNLPLPVHQTDLLYDVLDHLPAAIVVVTLPDFRILAVNARACARLGMRLSGDLVGSRCADVIPRFEADGLAQVWLAAAGLSGTDTHPTQAATQSAGGARRWQATPLRSADGTVERLMVHRIEVAPDPSVRPEQQFASSMRDTAQALISTIDRDQLLGLILEQLGSVVSYDSAAIMLRDEQGYYVAAGRGFGDQTAVLGLRFQADDPLFAEIAVADEVIILRDALQEERLKMPLGPIRGWMGVALRAQGETVGILTIDSYAPNRYTLADAARAKAFAAYAAMAVRNAELYHQARERSVKLEQALADLRVTQQRLVQSERLSAVGELVAGVAHELNNPLTAVLGFASILQNSAPPDLQLDVSPIVEGATRARRIVQNLLTFARQREANVEEVDLNQATRHVLNLYGYLLRSDSVVVEERLAPNLPTTFADMTAIQQVLLNLINNARQALVNWPGERRVIVRTFAVEAAANGERRVGFEVADSGPGIAPEHLAVVFEPFFTTKPVGEGTGLGLSICYGIVKQYGGEIRVESQPGAGARFIVELPVRTAPPLHAAQPPVALAEVPPARRILVIDDEPVVASLMERLLQGKGYQVETCQDGRLVPELLHRGNYDLVISDIKMPEFGGAQVYAEVTRRSPEMRRRLLFVSGDTLSLSTREFLTASGSPFLEKPFDVDEFTAMVDRLLAAEG